MIVKSYAEHFRLLENVFRQWCQNSILPIQMNILKETLSSENFFQSISASCLKIYSSSIRKLQFAHPEEIFEGKFSLKISTFFVSYGIWA